MSTPQADSSDVVIEYKGKKGRAAHERKQLKKDEAVTEQLATLQRGILSEAKFSAGSVQPTRFRCTNASLDRFSFVYATGKVVLEGHVNLALSADEQADVTQGTQGANISNIVKMKPMASEALLTTPVHKYEIQSIAARADSHPNPLIASIDARGAAFLYTKSTGSTDDVGSPQRKKQKQHKFDSHTLTASTTAEVGWAGIALDPTASSSVVATAHFFAKELRFFDATTLQSTWVQPTVMHPTALTFSPTLASTAVVAEYNQFSIWDAKSNKRVARDGAPSQGCLYAIACSPDGHSIAMGGEDKVAYIYDTRMWKLRNRWRCPLKYDIAYLAFSPSQSSLCYVAGLDNELMCGEHDASKEKKQKHKEPAPAYSPSILQQNHRLGFRGDSRWIGLDIVSASEDEDMGVGICESGSAYVIRPAQYMLGH
ncbi:hypothetical protein SPRG_13407 [Saprolegnia parasitica CBS 223.65]|uniref:Anaphase-promoting complex subunit 4 WD40 domain-containing protein n=1 Tax=Saprolegnia parasitica (strain CBS 223.65) TaxID=695850 RepID=A0A067BQ98_SAPPC|nr:hypothetical protein SPRG_13407 [Saprolegnia parasitica CBS 223.65]KDO20654.1 hypothetical protein SPRG_13407 [Saprolegnia parasitica CBS 223.65]|eukprot:XP_012208620.1 hypothetical protein SPRG_13407 [Saprolegnia parasitica CBS 223.65]